MKLQNFLLQAVVLGALVVTSAADAQLQRVKKRYYVSLTMGISETLKVPYIPPGARFRGDFRKVTRVEVANNIKQFRFTPKKIGIATLEVLDSRERKVYEIRIDVKRNDLHKVAREIRALLTEVEGITVKVINNKVVVDGQILLPRDMSRIISVVNQYGDKATSIVSMSPIAERKIAQFIERDINNPEIHVRAVNSKFIIEGVASSVDEKNRAEIIAKTYVPDLVVEEGEGSKIKTRKVDTVINLLTIKAGAPPEPGKIVQIVLHYVELQKDYVKGFRFQWTPTLADGSEVKFSAGSRDVASGAISSITGVISNLLPKLNWAKQHGHARILESSSIIVQDGQKGEMKSITRIPYQIISPTGQPSTNFEESGIITGVTPKILGSRSDSIRLQLDFSMKALVSISDQGPLVSNSALQTVIVVRSGQSAAVGGLISNSSGTNFNKLPRNVSDNPLISLYASKDFRRNQSQFVVFATPIIKSSASSGAEKIKRKFRLRD